MRIIPTDHSLARSVGSAIPLGKAFAFVGKDAFAHPALSWVARIVGPEVKPKIVPLISRDPIALPGTTVEPGALPALSLAAVTSDKALYREGRDEVHLLALDPLAPNASTAVHVRAGGAPFAKHAVTLDARGAAAITLRDLPVGDYEARMDGAPASSPACAFTVAAYRLAPLTAALVDRQLSGARLDVRLRLESFGAAVEGKVLIELVDRGARLARVEAEARGGLVTARLQLSGEGPHAINVQLAADAGKTATVPIVGSRAAERSQTTFSTLGAEITGALLPGDGATPVRGLWLREGALRTTPFRLDRVDTARARITASADVEAAMVLVLDPTFPAKRSSAVDPATAPHPATTDERYRRGESLFQEGRFAEAGAAFAEARAELAAPHPNYAYYLACCAARRGDRDGAVAALRAAIADGWTDFALLAKDDDLAALRGDDRYRALCDKGVREIDLGPARAGQSFEIDVPEPMGILAIGAFVRGEAWEGWAATITPASMAPVISAPERAAPGDLARVEIDTGRRGDDVSLYVVVKDARLLTPDTPESRLAGGLKATAEEASKQLGVGKPQLALSDHVPFTPPPHFGPPMPYAMHAPSLGGPPPPMGMPAMALGSPIAGSMPLPSAPAGRASMPLPRAAPAPLPGAPPAAPSPYREAPALPPPPAIDEPEVLFAGLVPTRGGKASLSLQLGADFADYLIEAFAIAGADWAAVEERFRAEKEVFASLDVPAFVHPDDAAVARVHVGSRSGARVRVTRDGAEVALLLDGRALGPGEAVPAGRAELSFLCGPGAYEALIEDASGARDRAAKEVEIPGKLRRRARTVRFLEPGERISRDDDPAIVALRVLPGLDGPFTALCDATSDYGHACCEQTAAKMLAACAMYALAGDDRRRRDRAESIIAAGVRRERSMWLRGRGFKMYPESSAEPTPYWGPLAAKHLWNLRMVRDLGPGRALAEALDEGLTMASDTTRAYGVEWPPRSFTTCQDAYAALRFGDADGAAVSFVRDHAGGGMIAPPASPYHGGVVASRAETSYAAAVLLRGGVAADRPRALALANAVLAELGPSGRLYSTVDSVAAIALAAELVNARVVGGRGDVEIDGVTTGTLAAASREGEVRAVRAIDAVTAVEVTRTIEEDWGAFGASLPIAVSLRRGDVVTRRLEALDAVDLEVTLEGGYKPGDLLWVALPDALSRVVGGGQVKQFSVDFEGKNSVRVPLAATGVTVRKDGQPGPARFAVCVRNMFEEERGGSPGYVEVTVAPPAAGGVLSKVMAGIRGLFGG